MKNINCNICNVDDYTILFPAGVAQPNRIVRCNGCGLMYANPQVGAECDDFDDSDVYAPEHPSAFSKPPASRQWLQKQETQLPDNVRALRVLNDLCPERGKLLEIGSCLSVFLNRIREDEWEVTGLEPDSRLAYYSRQQYGLNVVAKLLPDAGFPDSMFDAVVMLHVIEHMPDPAANVREIRRILKPGGILVVETPRYDTLMFKLFGHRERNLRYPGHIFFFTVPTLHRMLAQSGFEVVRTEIVGRTLTLDRLLHNVGRMSGSNTMRSWLTRFGAVTHLDKVRMHVNARDIQRVFARAV